MTTESTTKFSSPLVTDTSVLNITGLTPETVITDPTPTEASATYTKYTLKAPGVTTSWTFEKSFPQLPITEKINRFTQTSKFASMLDHIHTAEVHVLVSDSAEGLSEWGTPLKRGINFVLKIYPESLLSSIGALIGGEEKLLMYGHLKTEGTKTGVLTPELEKSLEAPKLYPWDISDSLPGIHLQSVESDPLSIGSAQLQNCSLKVYTPLESSWTERNDIFQPVTAFTAELTIPDADIVLESTAVIDSESSAFFLDTRFSGVSIGKLAALAGLTGSDLTSSLPDSLLAPLQSLESLELLDLGIGISLANKSVSLDFVSIGIGFRDIQWNLWEDHFALTDLSMRFNIHTPFKKPYVGIELFAGMDLEGVPLQVHGAKEGKEYTITTRLGDSQTLPLKKLMQKIAPDVPPPSDLTIDALSIIIIPGRSYSISGRLAGTPNAWKIDLGPKTVAIQNLSFNFKMLAGSELTRRKVSSGNDSLSRFSGSFRGEVKIGTVLLSMKYTIPGDFMMRSDVPLITLKSLYKSLTGKTMPAPSGFDFELKNTAVVIKKDATGFIFQAMTTIPKVGLFAFETGRIKTSSSAKGMWGGVVGVSLDKPKLSSIPGLDFFAPVEKIAKMQNLMIVASSYESTTFKFPQPATFNNTSLNTTGVPMPVQSGGVVKGFTAQGQWVFKKNDKQQKLMRSLLGAETSVDVTLQVDMKQPKSPAFSLFTSMETKIGGTTIKGAAGIRMQTGAQPELFLAGSSQFKIGKRKYSADVGASFVSSGLSFAGTLKGTIPLKGLKISNVSVMGSMNWAGVPGLGFAGSLDIKSIHGSIALMADSATGAVVVAGAISELNAYQVVTDIANVKSLPSGFGSVLKKIELKGTKSFTIPKKSAAAFNDKDLAAVSEVFQTKGKVSIPTSDIQTLLVTNKKNKMWSLTDQTDMMKQYQITVEKKNIRVAVMPQLYVCPIQTKIGTLQFPQGFLLSASIKILDLVAYASVQVSPSKGIAAEAYVNKALTIYKKSFFCLSDNSRKKGPYLSLSTYKQPRHKVKEFRNPHLYLDGKLVLLGLQVSALAKITSKGLDVQAALKATAKVNLNVLRGSVSTAWAFRVAVNSPTDILADFSVQLKLKSGFYFAGQKVASFNATIKGRIKMGFDGKKAYAKFTASTKVMGSTCKISIGFKVDSQDFKKLDKLVLQEIGDFFEDMYDDVGKFVEDVGKGILKGFKEADKLAGALEKQFNQDAKAVVKTFDKMGKDVDDVGKALKKTFKLSSKDAAKTLKGMRKSTKYIAGTLKKGFGSSANDIGNALKGAGISEKSIKSAMKDVGVATKDIEKFSKSAYKSVDKAAKDVGKTAKKGWKAVKSIF